MLLEALRACDHTLLGALGALATWNALAALWDEGWLGTRATPAQVRAHLREVARARTRIADAGGAAMALLEGTELDRQDTKGAEKSGSGAWRPSCLGGQFLLDDASAEVALVHAADARIVPGKGPRVTVLGFAGLELDLGAAAVGPRALPRRMVIRGGADRRMIVVRAAAGPLVTEVASR